MLRRRPKELFEVMGSHGPHEGAIGAAPQARKRSAGVESWGGAPIVVLGALEQAEEAAPQPETGACDFDELIAPRSLADEETQNLPAVGGQEPEPFAEPAEDSSPTFAELEAAAEPTAVEPGPRKRRFVSLDTHSSQRLRAQAAALKQARAAKVPPASAKPKAALAAPIPPNATGDHPSTWVGELAMWGSQTFQLRRDTLLVALAILGVSLLLAFLFGQKLGEMAGPAGSALEQCVRGWV